jgi:hypothetical protein
MSLLFDHAIERFDLSAAALHDATDEELGDAPDTTVPVEPVAAFAAAHDSLAHPDRDWTCLPLHGPDDAEVRHEYVAYTEHDLHGPIFVVERDGDLDHVDADAFGGTELARRLRFWHSDYLPDERPPSYDAPIDDHEPARNPVDRETLFDGLGAYVADEREAARARNRERARRHSPAALYEQGGDAVPAMEARGESADGHRFRVDLPPALADRRDGDWAYFVEGEFGIHEGNEALLHAPDDDERFPVRVTVAKIRGLTVWLDLDWAAVDDAAAVGNRIADGDDFGLTALLNPVPFDREAAAVTELRERDLGGVLAGERPITFSNGAKARSSTFDDELNQEQQLAVEFALLADDLFPVHGPPGTGKTRTLVEIVRRAVEAGEDVLVCADSNQAVDNLVAGGSTRGDPDEGSLHAHAQHGTGEFTLDRLNAERSAHDVVRRRYGDVAGRADVVAATNSSAATLAREFDRVVLDEATQATCTASAIPLSRARSVVLAGDHRQLPPYSATEEPPESSYGLSLFEHLYAGTGRRDGDTADADEGPTDGAVYEDVGLQLRTQYRMHRDIAYLPSREFYGGSLRNGRAVSSLPDRRALQGFDIGGHVETVDHSRRNHAEARLTTHLVGDLLADHDLGPEEVGVITPYSAQVRLLRRYLDERLAADGVDVATVDAFQGGEKTAIVVSLVRSNGDGDLGFLGRPEDGPRRLNVALTRAKRYCAVVADWHTLRYDADGKATDLYRTLHDHFDGTGRLRSVEPEFLPVERLDG